MSSHSHVLQNNRVFLDFGSDYAVSTTITSGYASSNSATFDVSDSTNFKTSGFLNIDDETIYYSSRTNNTFSGITRAANATVATDHISGSTITQPRPIVNPLVTTDSQLAGWYVDGKSNQASLRVYDAPVIQPGVIRFKADDSSTEPVFQGCYASNSNGIYWADFNAQTGPAGTDGDVNAILVFEHIDTNNEYSTSDAGEIIKTTTNDTSTDSNIEVRRIISGTRAINQSASNTIAISTTSNDVILNPMPIPYTWDLTANISTAGAGSLKGDPINDSLLNSYGDMANAWVVPGYKVFKGQVVYLTPFTSDSVTYMGIRPMEYSALSQLNNYKTNTPSIGLGMLGIAREDSNGVGVTAIDVNGVTARLVTSGMGIIKMSNNVSLVSDGSPFRVETAVNYTGRPCLLSKDGFGFNNDQEPSVGSSTYFQVGWFMETGASVGTADNYVLIKLAPRFV